MSSDGHTDVGWFALLFVQKGELALRWWGSGEFDSIESQSCGAAKAAKKMRAGDVKDGGSKDGFEFTAKERWGAKDAEDGEGFGDAGDAGDASDASDASVRGGALRCRGGREAQTWFAGAFVCKGRSPRIGDTLVPAGVAGLSCGKRALCCVRCRVVPAPIFAPSGSKLQAASCKLQEEAQALFLFRNGEVDAHGQECPMFVTKSRPRRYDSCASLRSGSCG